MEHLDEVLNRIKKQKTNTTNDNIKYKYKYMGTKKKLKELKEKIKEVGNKQITISWPKADNALWGTIIFLTATFMILSFTIGVGLLYKAFQLL